MEKTLTRNNMSFLKEAVKTLNTETDINKNIEEIIYLDQDFTTFEYFLTGKYRRPMKINLDQYNQAEMTAKL